MFSVDFTVYRGATVTTQMAARLQSWGVLHTYLTDLKDSEQNLSALARMIGAELDNQDGPRKIILTRLHMRFNKMRSKLEFAKVIKHAKR